MRKGVLAVKKIFAFVCMLCMFIVFCQPNLIAEYNYHGPEAELIMLINTVRAKNGAPPLSVNWEVARLARYKSEEMKRHGMFSHESLVYGSPEEQLARFQVPHTLVGANIAMGQESPREVLEAWLGSQGHHANLVNVVYTSAGVGFSADDDGIYFWTLMLVGE